MENKSVLASTTNWAAVIGVLGAVLPVFGFDLGTGAGEDVVQAVGAVTTAVSAVWIVVQRWKRGDLYIRKA